MPRLLLITPDFPPAHGGIQLYAHRLAGGLKGFDTRVIALDGDGAREFDRGSGLDVRRVPSYGRLRGARNVPLNTVALLEALRFRPDVTLSLHLVASPAAAGIRAMLGAPIVQYFHAKEIGGKPKLAAFAAARADVVIAVSAYTAGLVNATGAAPRDMRLISPGVDLPAPAVPQRTTTTGERLVALGGGCSPASHDERPTFVTIARLEDRYKGHDVLVRALALIRERVPDVRWAVIGEGPLRGELEALARAHRVADSIRFLGALSDGQRDAWLARASLLAMPSRLPGGALAGEGFGIAYLEAGAHGKPVVAGNVGGALDAVQDGHTGLLVDPTDTVAVADAIAGLLLDSARARRLGAAGAERARGFAWPLIAQRVEAVLLEQIVQSPP